MRRIGAVQEPTAEERQDDDTEEPPVDAVETNLLSAVVGYANGATIWHGGAERRR